MYRGFVFALIAAVASAQSGTGKDPVPAAINAYQTAHDEGRVGDAGAQRELARSLLDKIPADSPELGKSARSVAQLYQDRGLTLRAVATAKQALTRATEIDSRIALLRAIADFYQQDRNLLQAIEYREKAVAAIDEMAAEPMAPPHIQQPEQAPRPADLPDAGIVSTDRWFDPADSPILVHQQLGELYKQAGRPDALAALTERMVLIVKKNPFSHAYYCYQNGQLDEAIAIWKEQSEGPSPELSAQAFGSLAGMYYRQRRFTEAAEAMQRAITVLDATGQPYLHDHAINWRSQLASLLHQSGQIAAADEAYKQLLAEAPSPSRLIDYTSYLSLTKRDPQAMALLKDYLTGHPDLNPLFQAQLLMELHGAAFRAGNTKLAAEYQQAALEKQKSVQQETQQIHAEKGFRDAIAETRAGRFERGFELSMEALNLASRAVDRNQSSGWISSIASEFENRGQSEKAERLFQSLLSATQSWKADDPQPLMTALENHARFLMRQPSGWEKTPAEIKRLRDEIVATHGATSGAIERVLQLMRQFELRHGTPQGKIAVAQQLLTLNESLAGNSSESYLRASDDLAHEYQSIGDMEHAMPILRRDVAIADLAFPAGNVMRAYYRGKFAMELAQRQDFEEAEKLAIEAVAIGKAAQPPDEATFAAQLLQIRQMMKARVSKPRD